MSRPNMIDRKLRTELSQDIRRLATGRMTNDAFDDRYCKVYECSDDRAVNAISTYCYCLYSSDLLWPIRLRGRYALDAETKRTIARSVLFLHSDDEYGWPPLPDNPPARFVAGLAYSLGFPGSVAISLIGLDMTVFAPEPLAYLMLAIGLPLTAVCFYVGFIGPTVSPDVWNQYAASGDYECWPFLSRESFQSARKSNFLLGH
jgi:hypothetical protein